MLNVEQCHSAPQLFGLPYQHMMIVEDFKNVCVFAIESQSEDESTRDRSYTRRWIYAAISSLYPATFNVYRYKIDCASRFLQLQGHG